MSDLHPARTCELHVHPGGCLTPEDLLELGKDDYHNVDWTLFTESYQEAYGTCPDPIALFRDALSDKPGGLKRFEQHVLYTQKDSGDFGRFQAKFNLIPCLMRHLRNTGGEPAAYFRRVVDRHRREGITHIEYRCGFIADSADAFLNFHRSHAAVLAAQEDITARYIISLRRWAPLEDYEWVQRLLNQNPDLVPTIVGIDFAHVEEGYPPKNLKPLFDRIRRNNRQNPDRALNITYHVGESYFDKSLESAIRWCHEIAQMGVKRLGHAIALGLDPEVAITRRPNAHTRERVDERLDQIAYDLSHADALKAHDVEIDPKALKQEQQHLQQKAPDETVERPYNPQRLAEIRKRQQFVRQRLATLGAVIETCPTSNLRIGGVPDPVHHPIHTFLESPVNLAVCADDPGIFNTTLSNEIDWVLAQTHHTPQTLHARLGDPRRFLLTTHRPAHDS